MQYLAILGRQPEFGLVELESLIGPKALEPFGRGGAVVDRELDLGRLGGVIKLGRIVYRGRAQDLNECPLALEELPLTGGKTTFGLSYYGLQATPHFVLKTGLTLKKRLRAFAGAPARLVPPQQGLALTAAQVKFNGLTRPGGCELLVAVRKQEMVVAVTEQVQDIDWYAARDYQRPTRSAKVGMLPPKLAQIMVNTTAAPLVYDPFCGTGVVLQETLLLGRQAAGSDLSADMVAASADNLAWLHGQRPELPAATVHEADARQLELPDEPLAIVSEGYLGPHLSQSPTKPELTKLQTELGELYAASLQNWARQLPAGAEVTITVPAWRIGDRWHPTTVIDRLSDFGYTLRSFAHADSRRLAYHRPRQVVGRQLLILTKR